MFAISFDMSASALKEFYGSPYNRAYFEIKKVLRGCGFKWIQGSPCAIFVVTVSRTGRTSQNWLRL